MKQSWSVSSRGDSGTLHIYDLSLKNRLKLGLVSAVDTLDGRVLNHWLCGSGLPDLAWKIPVGRPRYDADYPEILDNSLGATLYHAFTVFYDWGTRTEEEDEIFSVPLDKEALAKLAPESSALWDEDEEA